MEISEAFDTMVQLEKKMSECFKEISQICHDEEISKELMMLSRGEIDHMNLLAAGKNYLNEAPDLFGLKCERTSELSLMQNRIDTLINNIQSKKIGLIEAINDTVQIERQLEECHLSKIAEVKDASLKKLFDTLSLGDKEHKRRLFKVMQILARRVN
jgi:rubrerythrin